MRATGIGTGIALLAVGAVLAFAVTTSVSGVDLQAIGVILMVAGALSLAITLYLISRTTTPPPADPRYTDPRYTDRDVY